MSKPNEKLEALFEAALALETDAQRAAYLLRACPDPALRQEVESLLAAHQNPDSVFADATVPTEVMRSEDVGTVIGPYKLLEALGEGGFGTVWLAEQKEPVRRKVALKVIKLGLETKQVVARFEAERQALALMDHPNVARILDAGTTDTGRPYFVMELVRGIPITKFCDENNLATRDRLDLFIKVCHAVQHAHQKGIIHRDLKPSNILVTLHDGVPVPKVIDFGIAKATQQELTDKTLHTLFQQFIGTPAYVSPEQAEMSGLDIDTRSDIYSLGVLLYELLTGKTPFDSKELLASGLDEMRRIIREREPARPSTRLSTMVEGELAVTARHRHDEAPKLIHSIRGDLDWIVMKCLEKDRTRRYETANGLGTDIERYLTNEPVVARPPSATYRLHKLIRRNKMVFAAGAGIAAVLAAGIVVSTWQGYRAYKARQRAVAERDRAVRAESQAVQQARLAESARGEAERSAVEENRQRRLADDRGATLQEKVRAVEMNLAYHAWEEGDFRRARDLLNRQLPEPGQADFRDFDWRWLWRLCQDESLFTFSGGSRSWNSAAISPDGRQVATAGAASEIQLWDLATRSVVTNLTGHTASIAALAYSPDGKILASATGGLFPKPGPGELKLWDLASHREIASLPGHTSWFWSLAFSPSGTTLASANEDGTVRLWDVAKRKEQRSPLSGHKGAVMCVAFAPDGKTVATAGADGTVRFWNPAAEEDGVIVTRFPVPLVSLAFAPDGNTLALCTGDYKLCLWDRATGRVRASLSSNGQIYSAAFSPDGDTLGFISGCAIKLYSYGRMEELATLGGAYAYDLRFSPDGRRLVSISDINEPRLWECAPRPKTRILTGHQETVYSLAFSPDGKRLATGEGDYVQPLRVSRVKLWDLGTEREVMTFPPEATTVYSIAFSPDGNTLAWGCYDASIKLWDLSSRPPTPIATLRGHTGGVLVLAFAPDGRTLVSSGGTDQTVRIWDLATRQTQCILKGHTALIRGLALSPDGQTVFTCAAGAEGTARTWDAATGKLRHTIAAGGPALGLALSPDGSTLAVIVWDVIKLYAVTSREHLGTLQGHHSAISQIAFSPEGKILASGGIDGAIKLWNVAAKQEVATLRDHLDGVFGVAFSPDGNTLASVGRDKTVRLRRAPSFSEIARAGEKTGPIDPIPARDPAAKPNLIDLSAHYNAALTESWHGSSGNTLAELPVGLQSLDGVLFDIRGIVQLRRAPQERLYPAAVNGIAIHSRCRHIHFLHSAGWGSGPVGTLIGRYIVHYQDGRSQEIPLRLGDDLYDWHLNPREPKTPKNSSVAWTGANPVSRKAGNLIQLFKTTWANPFPEAEVAHLDYVSALADAGPFLIAITTE